MTSTDSEEENLRCRLKKAEEELEQARCTLRMQGRLLIAWQKQLKEQDAAIRLLRKEREAQMEEIGSSVMLVEAELQREQAKIIRVVNDKDNTIAHQERQIHALLVLNRKLAAAAAKRLNGYSSVNYHRSRSTKLFSGRLTYPIIKCKNNNNHAFRDYINRPTEITPCVNGHSNGTEKQNGHCDCENGDGSGTEDDSKYGDDNENNDSDSWDHLRAVEESVRNYHRSEEDDEDDGGEEVYAYYPVTHSTHVRHLSTLEAVSEEDENEYINGSTIDHHALLNGSFEQLALIHDRGKHLSACYNRVMSNHRNVTKPKDVKYKKINRVKSRSLEELRGKLRSWSHPFTTVPEN